MFRASQAVDESFVFDNARVGGGDVGWHLIFTCRRCENRFYHLTLN